MSVYAAEFLRHLKKHFGPDADVAFTPHGFLRVSNEEGVDELIDGARLQQELGAFNQILTKKEISEK